MSPCSIAHLNIRSLLPKFQSFIDLFSKINVNIFAISETWLNSEISDDSLLVQNFSIVRKDRQTRGGGVALFVSNDISFKVIDFIDRVDQLWIKFKIRRESYCLGVIYRPPNSNINQFLRDLEEDFSRLISCADNFICVGDLNIDFLKQDNSGVKKLQDILEEFSLKQFVELPTRISLKSATLIDVLLLPETANIYGIENVDASEISDHDAVVCRLNQTTTDETPVILSYRDFKNFNAEEFYHHLCSVNMNRIYTLDNIDNKIEYLNGQIHDLFNTHAPVRTAVLTKKSSPWISGGTKKLITLRNKALLSYKKDKCDAKFEYYKTLRNLTTKTVKLEKIAYFKHILKGSTKQQLWQILKRQNIVKSRSKALPRDLSNPDSFNRYLLNNAPNNKHHNERELITLYPETVPHFKFKKVYRNDIEEALCSIKSKSMGHDGLDFRMLLFCTPYLLPFIQHIINSCITSSYFPASWKISKIMPLAKCSHPKSNDDLRPISILPILSKLFEKILYKQILAYAEIKNILPPMQSGFRKGHSCNTAILSVKDDILKSLDENLCTALIAIDFSKAFDRLLPKTLLLILKHWGFHGSAVSLVRSYFENRQQYVYIEGRSSQMGRINAGVPQGSVLGPLLFAIYSAKLHESVSHCDLHMYADDVQIYHKFKSSEMNTANRNLNNDIRQIIRFSDLHNMHVNSNKSQLIIFCSKKDRLHLESSVEIFINNGLLIPTSCIKSLGVLLDCNLQFKEHVNSLIKKTYMTLKGLYGSRQLLDSRSKAYICNTLVLSIFSFADSIYGPSLSAYDSGRIQVAQNSCIRFVYGLRKYDHVSSFRKKVGWLTMKEYRLLHSACLYHKILTTHTPNYLYDRVNYRSNLHDVNIRRKFVLAIPTHRKELYKQAFSYQISYVYNKLETSIKASNIKNFKFLLRQDIFENAEKYK